MQTAQPQDGRYKRTRLLLAFKLTFSKQDTIYTEVRINSITRLPLPKPSKTKPTTKASQRNQPPKHQILYTTYLDTNQTLHAPPSSAKCPTLSSSNTSPPPRSSKRASQSSHHNHPTIMNSSPAHSNNRADFRASLSSKGGEGKKGGFDWIRGMGRKV